MAASAAPDASEPRPYVGPAGPRVVAAVAIGGAIGAAARWALVTGGPGGVWATMVVNVAGSVLMGVLVTWLLDRRASPLVRPFLGTGVLGGFTTFSTYAADGHRLLAGGSGWVGTAYLLGTPVLAVAACALGVLLTRSVCGRRLPATAVEAGDLPAPGEEEC